MAAAESIDAFLKLDEQKELLRFSTAGSVDDGKSTLIGRLLVDSKGVYEDQVASARKASVNQSAGPLDFALLTDGLRAEREQGITIDVAYRYFATARRKFIIADTPGHEQYTRNMATGASTASLAIILVDARNGVLPQSRRHGYIAALLGIPNIVVCVNKMDLMDFRQDVYNGITSEFGDYAGRLGLKNILYMPVSALLGDNVVTRSENTPWYEGPALLEHLETVPIHRDRNLRDFRFPVQYVLRPNLDFRGFSGQVVSGVVRKGDSVMVLPSGRVSRVTSIVTYDGNPEEAWPPMSVTLCLEHEIDISRGDMLVHPTSNIHVARRFDAMLVWMNTVALDPDKTYLLKHTTHSVKATVRAIHHKVDVNSLQEVPTGCLEMNEIGSVSIETVRPLFFDPYQHNRGTGGFILIDPMTNETVAAGMIRGALGKEPARQRREESELELTRVTPGERYARSGHRPATVWMSGEPEIAYVAERKLFDRGYHVQVLDDAWPAELLPQLAAALNENGVLVLAIAPPSFDGAKAHAVIGDERFVPMDFSGHSGEAERAADEAIRRLEAAGIIPASLFDGGEGI